MTSAAADIRSGATRLVRRVRRGALGAPRLPERPRARAVLQQAVVYDLPAYPQQLPGQVRCNRYQEERHGVSVI